MNRTRGIQPKTMFGVWAALLLSLTMSGCSLSVLSTSNQPAVPASGALPAGYRPFPLGTNPQLNVGTPWGASCKPIVLWVTGRGSADRQLLKQERKVIKQARSIGLRLYDVTEPGAQPVHNDTITVTVHTEAAPINPATGRPWRYDISGYYVRNHSTGVARLHRVQALVYLKSLNSDPVLERKVWRGIAGAAAGLYTEAPETGTGLAPHLDEAIDGFSDTDVEAMLTMSGCRPA